MIKNKLLPYILSIVLGITLTVLSLSVNSIPGSISTPYKTETQRIQLTNDMINKHFVLKNLNTGETEFLSSSNANLPVPTIEWAHLSNYPCSVNSSRYYFYGVVTLLRSTKPVDSSGAYLLALKQGSNIVGKYDQRFRRISGIHSAQWDVSASANLGPVHLFQATPDSIINIDTAGPISFGGGLNSLFDTVGYSRTTLTGAANGSSYQETWSNNSFRDGYAAWYPSVVALEGITTWYVPAGATITWTWNWSIQYR
jgi:hypothetical protein